MTAPTPDPTAWSPRLTTGDPELAGRIKMAAGAPGNFRTLSVALVSGGETRFAALGVEHDTAQQPATHRTAFEIGSVTKVLTGMLLSRLTEQGAVSPDQRAVELLPGPLAGRPAGEARLDDLAAHRSGLPRLHHRSLFAGLRSAFTLHRGRDPYRGIDRDAFLGLAAAVDADGPSGAFAYSNLGASLLGHALAEAAAPGDGYGALLEKELLGPLGMTRTRVHTDPASLPDDRALPHRRNGRPVEPWLSAGYAPSGVGVWSTAEDLSLLLTSVLSGAAPGSDATRPRFDAEGPNRIGFGWLTRTRDDDAILWHNGGTGGSCSFVGVHRATGRAIAVLADTDHDVDGLGAGLLLGEE